MSERRRRVDEHGHQEGRIFDLTEVQTAGPLPEGSYNMSIKSLEERHSSEKGILYYTMELRVKEPQACFGRAHYENMFFGTVPFDPGDSQNPEFIAYAELNDPEAEDPRTIKLSRGAQMMKMLLDAAGLDVSKALYMPEVIDLCNQGHLEVGCRIVLREEKGGPYAGTMRNRITFVYEVGRETPHLGAGRPGRRDSRVKSTDDNNRRRAVSPGDSSAMERAKAAERSRAATQMELPFDDDEDVPDVIEKPAAPPLNVD